MFYLSRLFHKNHKQDEGDDVLLNTPLRPLYPEIGLEQHKPYVERLKEALQNKRITNVALTGSYGSGKSSILEDFESEHNERVIRISFSALGSETDDFIAITGSSGKGKDRERKLASAIQKEIVKQLLFKERPADMPNSKFRRVAVTDFRSVGFWAALLSTVLLTGLVIWWPSWCMPKAATASLWLGLGWLVLVLFILFCLIAIGGLMTSQKIKIDKLSGGPVTLTISPSTNYFDDFLDEIIYFFEAAAYDIVVLEDIDRFKNMAIFEQLRQLNMLLNSSKQVGKRIIFIYAVRDSIFAEKTTESVTSTDSVTNRTKFFDLLIPTVPFATHRNSRDLVKQAFDDINPAPSEAVIKVVAKHLTDMRVILNIRNEYLIFHKNLITDGNIPGLSPDKLFAMVAYKNLHVQDFENIRLGKSLIDKVYDANRASVTKHSADVGAKLTVIRGTRARQAALADYARRNGEKLHTYIMDLMRQATGQLQSIALNGANYDTEASLQQLAFWQALSSIDGSVTLNIMYLQRPVSGYAQNFQMSVSLGRDDIAQIVGDSLDLENWQQQADERNKQQTGSLQEEARYLKTADMQQMLTRYDDYAGQVKAVGAPTGGLLYDLIESGYIDRNYMLYTSVYHGVMVAPQAMSFIMKNVDTETPDFLYDFGGDRVIAGLLRELGSTRLTESALYNVQIVDYLMQHPKTVGVADLLSTLAVAGDEERNFISVYLQNSKYSAAFIERLSSRWDGVFDYLLVEGAPWRQQTATLVDAAIKGSSQIRKYPENSIVHDYITQNIAKIDALVNRDTATHIVTKVKFIISRFAIKIPRIGVVNPALRDYLIEGDHYRIDEPNLKNIMQGKPLALDEIRAVSADAYDNMIKHSAQYMEVVAASNNTPHTIVSNDDFSLIIFNLADAKAEALNEIIAGASANCLLISLEDVPPIAWQAVLDHALVTNTFINTLSYATQQDTIQIDDRLAAYLNMAADLSDPDDVPLEERRSFVAILLGDNRISVDAKVAITKSAELTAPLAISSFTIQTPALYTRLLDADLLEDSADEFGTLANADWSVRSAYLTASKQLSKWSDEVVLNADEIVAVIEDARMSKDFKHFVAEHLSDYGVGLSRVQTETIRRYVIGEGLQLSVPNMTLLANNAELAQVQPILQETLTSLSRDDFVQILSVMHDPYNRLALPGSRINLPDTKTVNDLLVRLTELEMVSKYPKANIKAMPVRKVSMKKWR